MGAALMRLLQKLLSCWAAVGCAIGVCGCAPGLDDTKSLTALKGANEGVVFLQLAYEGVPCRTGNIALARETSPGRFELYKTLMMGGITGSASLNSRQVSLPAGTYHIGYITCQAVQENLSMGSGYMMGIGEQDGDFFIGNPKQSLVQFTVASGEVVNLGQINLAPTDYLANSARISVTDLKPDAMNRLRGGVPSLASTMVTRLMTSTAPSQSYKIERVKLGAG
jgi:hypothetical protein